MASDPAPNAANPAEIRERLRQLARMLREAQHLEPDTRRQLAELADELAASGDFTKASSAEASRLLDTSARVIDALHKEPEAELPATLRERLGESIMAAEARAPVLAGVAHRLLDVLADLGI
jgi:hypothetical protein